MSASMSTDYTSLFMTSFAEKAYNYIVNSPRYRLMDLVKDFKGGEFAASFEPTASLASLFGTMLQSDSITLEEEVHLEFLHNILLASPGENPNISWKKTTADATRAGLLFMMHFDAVFRVPDTVTTRHPSSLKQWVTKEGMVLWTTRTEADGSQTTTYGGERINEATTIVHYGFGPPMDNKIQEDSSSADVPDTCHVSSVLDGRLAALISASYPHVEGSRKKTPKKLTSPDEELLASLRQAFVPLTQDEKKFAAMMTPFAESLHHERTQARFRRLRSRFAAECDLTAEQYDEMGGDEAFVTRWAPHKPLFRAIVATEVYSSSESSDDEPEGGWGTEEDPASKPGRRPSKETRIERGEEPSFALHPFF